MMEESTHKTTQRMRLAMTLIPTIALVICYAQWLFGNAHPRVIGVFFSAILFLLFILLGARFIPQWIAAWRGEPEMCIPAKSGKRSSRRSRLHPFFKIILAVLLSRILLFLAAYALDAYQYGYSGGIFDRLAIWNPLGTDTRHYLSIAENGYQTEGDARLLLVFFPLYPLVVHIFEHIFQDFLVSGMFVSNMMFLFSGYLLYELALLDMGRRTALRAVKYLCILPASCLFIAPMSDSLFLFLTISCLYLVRKKQYVLSCAVGLLASFTRVPGVLLLAPVCFELIADLIRSRHEGKSGSKFVLQSIVRCMALLLIPAGLGLYLFLNYRLTGDWFRFLAYQQSNWNQSMGWFFSTAEYQTVYALTAMREGSTTLYGLWLPNLIYLFSAPAIVIAAQKKLRASYVLYFLLYYAITMGATWLLSAPRYLTAAFPLALSLSVITEKRWADALGTVLCLIGLAWYLFAYLQRWSVY